MPPAVDVNEVLRSVFGDGVDAVSANEAFAEASDEGAVFFEDEEGVFWVVGDEVEETVFSLDHGVAVDDGGDCVIGFCP